MIQCVILITIWLEFRVRMAIYFKKTHAFRFYVLEMLREFYWFRERERESNNKWEFAALLKLLLRCN